MDKSLIEGKIFESFTSVDYTNIEGFPAVYMESCSNSNQDEGSGGRRTIGINGNS